MQPMGRKKQKWPGKIDWHLKNGLMNWWEDMVDPKKKTARQKSKCDIRNKLKEM
jgi:hypothetical protein